MNTLFLDKLRNRSNLSSAETEMALDVILRDQCAEADVVEWLTLLRDKGETADEIFGVVQTLRKRMVPLPCLSQDIMDVCGTGGDGQGTFNISTAVAFVVAGCGVKVAKHGNRAVSSKSGSSDVLAALGVNIDASPQVVGKCIDDVGIGFLFAPQYHPILKKLAPIRKKIGTRTIFNIVGPLLNPALVKRQVIGVYSQKLLSIITDVLKKMGSVSAAVVCGDDGLDEITMTGQSHLSMLKDAKTTSETFDPIQVGYAHCSPQELQGGDAATNAKRLKLTLKGHSQAIDHCVHINAALALKVAGLTDDWREALLMVQESISGGKAYRKLEELIEVSNS